MTGRADADAAVGAEDSPEKRYYRIGEVSRITGVKPYVLRYWESEFRFMSPQKSRSQQRLYRRRDIDIILLVKKLLYEQRFTIAGARKKLREMGVGRALETGTLAVETDHRARYRRIRDELREIRSLLGEAVERAPSV
jgi:DNA-binding transcriptional MerR regulator